MHIKRLLGLAFSYTLTKSRKREQKMYYKNVIIWDANAFFLARYGVLHHVCAFMRLRQWPRVIRQRCVYGERYVCCALRWVIDKQCAMAMGRFRIQWGKLVVRWHVHLSCTHIWCIRSADGCHMFNSIFFKYMVYVVSVKYQEHVVFRHQSHEIWG